MYFSCPEQNLESYTYIDLLQLHVCHIIRVDVPFRSLNGVYWFSFQKRRKLNFMYFWLSRTELVNLQKN